jgi:uncharacterized protein YbaR (Trm112 family)
MDEKATNPVNGRNLGLSEGLLAILVCPIDHGKLVVKGDGLQCSACGREYPVEHGIPHLVVDHTPET